MSAASLSLPASVTGFLPHSNPWTWVPRTQAGLIKRRTTAEDKLRLLDPGAPPEVTKRRLEQFARLFAFWRWKAICQPEGKHWFTLKHPLADEEIVRHLLGNRLPNKRVTWVGTRAFQSTRYCLIDVDADDTPERCRAKHCDRGELTDEAWHEALDDIKRELARKPQKPLYTLRCRQVEDALRLMGIDPSDATQVLIQPTPSGGRHYIFFLDASYHPCQLEALLKDAGLRFADGQIECYPNAKRGIRLPFGWIPGQPHDPKAWIRFIDHYTAGRIKRFAIHPLYENLAKNRRRSQPTPQPQPALAARPTRNSAAAAVRTTRPPRRVTKLSTPRTTTTNQEDAIPRYQQLIEQGIRSQREADELLALGIRSPGTRTQALKMLALHLTWFRHLPEEDAAATLTAWAMDPRHDSKDIHADLQRGTNVVASDIKRLCRWAADHQRTPASVTGQQPVTGGAAPRFTDQELATLRPMIQALPTEERAHQAHFLLRFLWVAKRLGQPLPDGSAWEAAPSIKDVVKKWPGCRHGNDYKRRLDRATAVGLLTMTKEKWQNPNGKGRNRTYRLAVPVVPEEHWVIDFDAALRALTGNAAAGAVGEKHAPEGTKTDERNHQDAANRGPASAGDHTAVVRPPSPGTPLATDPRQRPPQPHAAPGVHRPPPGGRGAIPPSAQNTPEGRQPAGDITQFLRQSYEEAKRRTREAARGPSAVTNWDGRPLPPPLDTQGITDTTEAIKKELEQQFPGHHVRDHATWQIVEAIARSPHYTTEERRLILSNPARLTAPNLEARKDLIRRHRRLTSIDSS